jgi:tetratricopeptide (TPR) repeat protein
LQSAAAVRGFVLEKFDIESMYHESVTGDLESATRVYREWLGSYPRDPVALGNLGNVYAFKGQFQQAVELDKQSLQLSPNDVIAFVNLSWMQLALNQFPDARRTIQDAFDHKLDAAELRFSLFTLAFLAGDERGIREQASWFEGKPETIHEFLMLQSSAEGYSGHLKNARELNRCAVEAAQHSGNPERALFFVMANALREATFGNLPEARRTALAALSKPVLGRNAQATGALALGSAGDFPCAELLMQELGKHFPQGTLAQSVELPTVRAQIELARKNPGQSIELLRSAVPYELTDYALGGCLYPVYVRAQAYLAAKAPPLLPSFKKFSTIEGW